MASTEDYKNELNSIDTSKNSDLAVVTKEIGELLNDDNTENGLENLSGSLTSGLSEYLKNNNEAVKLLLNVLNNLEEPYASSQEIASLKSFLQPLVKKDWSLSSPDEGILRVKLNIDSNKQKILISRITELQSKVTDLGLKNTLTQISQIVKNPNKQSFDQLSRFLDENNVVGVTPDSNSNGYVSTIINRLNMFLLSINSQIDTQSSIIDANDGERASENKAYNELVSYIPGNLKKLNKMSDKDLKHLDAFIQRPNNQSQVFDLYYKMKYGVADLNSEGMDSKDEGKFNNIVSLIEGKYKDSTELHEYELNKIFEGVESKSGSLKEFLEESFNKTDWNGGNLDNDFDVSKISDKYNFSKEEFIGKFNDLNAERTRSNNQKVSEIDVSSLFNEENLKLFTIEGEGDNTIIKYNGEIFNADIMLNSFLDGILNLVDKTNPDFASVPERNSCIKNRIFDKFVNYIKKHQPEQVDETDNQATYDVIDGKLEDFNLVEQVEEQINNALEKRNIEGKFYEKITGDDGKEVIKYNMNVIKQYLDTVKDEPYKGGGEDFKAITMAFQIALKYNFDGKYSDLGKIDGLFYLKDRANDSKTKEQILQFQKDYGTKETIKDGKPGPQTIKLLLNVLNGEISDANPTEGDNNPTEGSDNDPVVNTGDGDIGSVPEGDKKIVEEDSLKSLLENFDAKDLNVNGSSIYSDWDEINKQSDIQLEGYNFKKVNFGDNFTGLGYSVVKARFDDYLESIYIGNFENGKKNGIGMLKTFGFPTYIGEFKDNKKNGRGRYEIKYNDGKKDTYEGNFKNNIGLGNGKFTWHDGSKYEGNFAAKEEGGHITYVRYNGFDIGEMSDGKYTTKDGKTYEVKDGKYRTEDGKEHELHP